MPQTDLMLPITSSPLATLLAANGVARWLADACHDLAGDNDRSVIAIAYNQQCVTLTVDCALQPSQLTRYAPPLPKWLQTSKTGPAPHGLVRFDYEAERQRNAQYYATLKQLKLEGRRIDSLPQEQRQAIEPHLDWNIFAMLNQMGALTTYNKLIERWAACEPVYADLVGIIWTLCSGSSDGQDRAVAQWVDLAKKRGLEKDPNVSAMQAVNPEQGKGANRAKADALTIGGQDGFWLLEYFKFAGLFAAAVPRTIQSMKDRKTYVVIPSPDGIACTWQARVFGDFQKSFFANSSIKMDILAALRYTGTMLLVWEGAQRSRGRRRKPSDFVSGLAIASYKDLGSAFAVMNVATIGLPDWIDWPETADQAAYIQAELDQHQKLIMLLDEKIGASEQLLRSYRDFLSSRDPALAAFFDFTSNYASYLMSQLSKGKFVRRLTIATIGGIIMSNEDRRAKAQLPPLKRIVESQGFRNIATAIRQSTVTQQYHKVKAGDNTYDIRYGLADELRRHSRNNADFIQALNEFLADYSKENARVMERKKALTGYRRRLAITTHDVEAVVALVDEYDAATIASMLIAFGYARDQREDKEADAPAEAEPVDEPSGSEDESPF